MITIDDIRWGRYMDHEGPYYRGNQPYVLPAEPTLEQQFLAVVTATEGGAYNAVNMYDRCGVSLGLIQWCEFGQFSVSELLGRVSRHVPLKLPLDVRDYYLDETDDAKWRFFKKGDLTRVSSVIDTVEEQRRLFFLDATGELGSWDASSKLYAKAWAARLASIFEDETAKKIQLEYTTDRIDRFVLPPARELNPRRMAAHVQPWAYVGYATYLSFAANNPATACRMYQEYTKERAFRPTDKNWVIGLLKKLTFGPQFTIYPMRYNAIRPVLEKLFAVDLPDFATELWTWQQAAGIEPSDPEVLRLDTPKSIQFALITLGYDLGPAGADGVFGRKTRQAVITFQMQHGLTADGIVGPLTRRALADAIEHRGT